MIVAQYLCLESFMVMQREDKAPHIRWPWTFISYRSYSLFTLREPHSPLIVNGKQAFLSEQTIAGWSILHCQIKPNLEICNAGWILGQWWSELGRYLLASIKCFLGDIFSAGWIPGQWWSELARYLLASIKCFVGDIFWMCVICSNMAELWVVTGPPMYLARYPTVLITRWPV